MAPGTGLAVSLHSETQEQSRGVLVSSSITHPDYSFCPGIVNVFPMPLWCLAKEFIMSSRKMKQVGCSSCLTNPCEILITYQEETFMLTGSQNNIICICIAKVPLASWWVYLKQETLFCFCSQTFLSLWSSLGNKRARQ